VPYPCSVVLDSYLTCEDCDLSLYCARDVWSLALDQRAFGPRRLVIAFGDDDGRMLGLTHTPREEPPELTFGFCIEHFLQRADTDVAIAYCDEPVTATEITPRIRARWSLAREIADDLGIELLDWIACDDHEFRSARLVELYDRGRGLAR
jgi:hypothetical protein